MLNYEEYIELLQKRRSIRAYTDQNVSLEDIEKIVDATRFAPSGMNYQPWEFVVVRDKAIIKQITDMKPEDLNIPKFAQKAMEKSMSGRKMPKGGMKQAKNANVLIIAIGDTRKQINLPGQLYSYNNGEIKLKKDLKVIGVEGLFYSAMANAFLQMITAAASLGLGSQYVTITSSPMKRKKVKAMLGIPEYMRIYDAAAIGYPAYEPRKKFTRGLDEILHFDQYDSSKSWSDEKIVERAKNRQDMKFLAEDEFV